MVFDLSVRAGDVLTVLSIITMSIVAIMNMRGTLRLFAYRLDVLDATVEDFKKDYANTKVQDAEIMRLKEDQTLLRTQLHDLQRGRGFIQDDVDGRYGRTGKAKI